MDGGKLVGISFSMNINTPWLDLLPLMLVSSSRSENLCFSNDFITNHYHLPSSGGKLLSFHFSDSMPTVTVSLTVQSVRTELTTWREATQQIFNEWNWHPSPEFIEGAKMAWHDSQMDWYSN